MSPKSILFLQETGKNTSSIACAIIILVEVAYTTFFTCLFGQKETYHPQNNPLKKV